MAPAAVPRPVGGISTWQPPSLLSTEYPRGTRGGGNPRAQVPNPDDRVEWELWTTAIDASSLDFLSAFRDTVVALGTRQQFTPMMYTYNGSEYGCDLDSGAESLNLCGNLCTNDGKYCAPDPDGRQDEGISGAQVVAEDLRRACLWSLVGGAARGPNRSASPSRCTWNRASPSVSAVATLRNFRVVAAAPPRPAPTEYPRRGRGGAESTTDVARRK